MLNNFLLFITPAISQNVYSPPYYFISFYGSEAQACKLN